MTYGTYPWSSVTHISRNGWASHDGDRKTLEMTPLTEPLDIIASAAYLLAATLNQGNPEGSYKLWNIVLTERYILHAGDAWMLLL